jgi:hypothetical protein
LEAQALHSRPCPSAWSTAGSAAMRPLCMPVFKSSRDVPHKAQQSGFRA